MKTVFQLKSENSKKILHWGMGKESSWNFVAIKKFVVDFSGGPVDKNSPAHAGHMGSIPGLGRFHMPRGNEACEPQLLDLCSRTWEPQRKKPSQ